MDGKIESGGKQAKNDKGDKNDYVRWTTDGVKKGLAKQDKDISV